MGSFENSFKMASLKPSDYTKKKPLTVNGRALTSTKQAFFAGMRAGIAGKSRECATYSNPLMVEAWQAGWDKNEQLERAKK